MILDQNIMNAWAMDMSQVKEVISLRGFASTFDPTATYIKWLSTSLLKVNMPELVKDYGSKSQFDLVSTIDKDKFVDQDDYSGFNITEDGLIEAQFNLVTYIKMAP